MDSTIDRSAVFGRGKSHSSKNRKASTAQATLGTNISVGLTDQEVSVSRKEYGSNSFTEKKQKGFLKNFAENLSDPIIKVLIIALFINMAFTFKNINWVEAGGIALTVFVSSFVSTLSEYSSGIAYQKLFKEADQHTCRVMRNGSVIDLPMEEIVVGDVILMSWGEIVPCDGVLVEGELKCDQSALTGESKEIRKTPWRRGSAFPETDPSNSTYLCRGSSVLSGEGVMVASAVGDATLYGSIASGLQEADAPSPLKERLSSLARTISRLGFICAAVVAAAYLFNSFIIGCSFDRFLILQSLKNPKFFASEILHALTLAISIVVVAVPEGLPMMITVVLSANMKRMMKSGVLVRRLVGIETAGSLSLLFTDKTGTVTSGKMSVAYIISNGSVFKSIEEVKCTPSVSKLISLGAQFCPGERGNMTDAAISEFVDNDRGKSYRCIDRIPFDSGIKYSAVLLEHRDSGDVLCIVRGAPDVILPCCSLPDNYDRGEDIMRTIAQAEGDERAFKLLKEKKKPPLKYTCSFCLSDRIRDGVREAVEDCHTAGVQVVMLTGDGAKTAAAVALEAGILPREYEVYSPTLSAEEYERKNSPLLLEAAALHQMDDETLSRILPLVHVISRATPSDKTRLVRLAEKLGHVVGMTGDGVNDAPALKNADVGFAMGSGSDVAREAGDIVISDNNFVSITKAVLYGRTIFESIRKFILFQLTMNLCAVGVSLIAPFFSIECPITITQMLWINIIMDTLGSLAFAGEAPLKSYMKRRPIRRCEQILTKGMIGRILFCGGYTLLLSLVYLTSERSGRAFGGLGSIHFLTVFFAIFVFCGIGNSFAARTERLNIFAGLARNKPFILIMALVAAVQLLMIYFGGDVFRTVPLRAGEIVMCALLGSSVVPVDFLRRIIFSAFLR